MQQTTLQEFLEYWLGSSLSLEDPFDQIEYVLTAQSTANYEARLQGIKYKASEAFLQALQNYAQWLEREGMLFKGIAFRDRELISGEQIRTQFYSYDSSLRVSNRIELLQRWLMQELKQLERKECNASWVEEEINYLDNEQYAEVFSKLHKEREVLDLAEHYAIGSEIIFNKRREDEGDFNFAEREEELLKQMIVKSSFKPLRQGVKKLAFIDIHSLYTQLFDDEAAYREKTGESELPELWPEICQQTKQKLARHELYYEDATPYLYLKELIEGVRTNKEIRHVFVDEGQDYSPFQYEYLKKLFPRARMTVLGDFGQAIYMQSTNLQHANSPLLRLYGEAETSLIRLTRSYRSTREIVEFTKMLLTDASDIVPFDRSGAKPLLVNVAGEEQREQRMLSDIAALQADGFESIAIITKTAAESRAAYEALQQQGSEAVQLITKETATFQKGVMVIPVYLAKGVEFDAVLIYEASAQAYNHENERKLLYTACTRAMHQLLLYSTGEWSPLLQGIHPDLYELTS